METAPSPLRDVDSGELEIRIVAAIEDEPSGDETLGSDPGLDDEHASRTQVEGQTSHGFPEVDRRLRITDRTEQARDDVEPVTKIEIDERALMEGNPWIAPPGDGQHVPTEIEALYTKPVAQMLQVATGPTPHVEQGLRVWSEAFQDLSETAVAPR
jgi:hypothetical protein